LKKILSLAAVFLLMTACGAKAPTQNFLDIRAEYLAADVSLSARVSADYGDRCVEYELSYIGDGKSGKVEVLEPDEIRGISAQIGKDKKVILKCGDVLIDSGVIFGADVTPVGVLPLIVNAVREGYVSSVYSERINGIDYLAVEIDETPAGESEKLIYTLWFSAEDNSLYKAEINAGGLVAVTALFEEV